MSIERDNPPPLSKPCLTSLPGMDCLLLLKKTNELIGNFDHYVELEKGYARNGFPVERPGVIYEYQCPEPGEPTPFEVNKEVVSIQDHNRFNPGPFQERSAIFPGHGVIAEDHSTTGRGSYRADDDLNDLVTGEGRPMNSWRNADPSPFEDSKGFLDTGYDLNAVGFGNRIDADIQRPTHPSDNFGANSGPGGSTYMTEKTGANPGQMLSPLSGGDGCPF